MNRKQRRAEASKGVSATHAAQSAGQPIFAAALQHFLAGRLGDAESLFRSALAIDPHDSDTLHMLGVIAYQTGRQELAVDLITKATRIHPTNASLHSNLGNLLMQQGRFDEAAACYRRAVALKPDFSEALNNLGNAFRAQQRLDEAIVNYRKALELKPDDAEVRYYLAMALLACGDMETGWQEHEWRWKTPQMQGGHRIFEQPQWQGEAAEGRTLLIHAEQGFGDTLQFCRYAPLASARGLRVILEVQKPLARLLRSLPSVDRIVVRGETLPPFDLHCPMMSMPLALGTTIPTIPGDVPYLQADATEIARWRSRLDVLGKPGCRIGLVWSGDAGKQLLAKAAVDRRRSIAPERLAPLFDLPGAHYVSLQKDGPPPPRHFAVTDFMAEMEDFADTAALIASLDLIVAVDTAVAHLAGALGKPVWLLDRSDPCWRWLLGRRDSPWYPSLRLYRQPRPGDWETVVSEVARDLSNELIAS